MRKKTFPITLSIILLLGLVVTASAITWGEPDGDDHPYVGIIYFETPTGIYRCSGTLLSPKVMLTAGHCTEEGSIPNYHTWVSFGPEIIFPDDLDIYDDAAFIAYLDKNFIHGEAIPHPGYDDYNQFPNTYDVGVVLLKKPVKLNEYGRLPGLGLLDTLIRGKGNDNKLFTAVGYGLQGYIPPYYSAERTRYQGTVSLIEVNSTFNGDQQSAKFTNNPGQGNGSGGTCFGDSGGPLFHGDTNVIGAIVSWGITPCIGVDYQFRMDTPVAQDFVRQYLR
jgi:hypothetical protein